MTVKELIEQLQTLDQNMNVLVSVTDPTDWTYQVEIESIYEGEDEEYEIPVIIIDIGIV